MCCIVFAVELEPECRAIFCGILAVRASSTEGGLMTGFFIAALSKRLLRLTHCLRKRFV